MSPIPTLESPRLRLRPWRADDAIAYRALCEDAEVMRFLGGVLGEDDAWRQMAMLVGHWSLRGFGSWVIEERERGRFVGRMGLHYPGGWPERELAYALGREWWGRGYGTEAGQVVLRYAFSELGWPRVVSYIDAANTHSIQLAQRLGARVDGTVDLRGHRLNVYAYAPDPR